MPRWKWRGWDAGGGFTQTGAEWKATDELARSLYDMMKPKVMRADIYGCKSMYIHLNQNPNGQERLDGNDKW